MHKQGNAKETVKVQKGTNKGSQQLEHTVISHVTFSSLEAKNERGGDPVYPLRDLLNLLRHKLLLSTTLQHSTAEAIKTPY